MRTIFQVSNKHDSFKAERVVCDLKNHARNLYVSRQLLCSEAVLVSLNKGLNGGLTEKQAVSMAAPFCVAMGDSGCLCGALSGAVLAAGLFIGNSRPYSYRKDMRQSGLALHNEFRTVNGSTCCRVLSRKVKYDKKAHFYQCANITEQAAEMAARLILKKRPDLLIIADSPSLTKRYNRLSSFVLNLYKRFVL